MDYDIFSAWLIEKKNLSQRAAKDVVYRCKRVCRILDIKVIESSTIENLNVNEDFNRMSMFIKSQLRRASKLWIEFGGK